MLFRVSLYVSLIFFIFGLIFKVSQWFIRPVGISAKGFTSSGRFFGFIKGVIGVFFSARLFTLVKAFILDVILQWRILKEDWLRWVMHMLIYCGFMLLLLMHALGEIITASVFSDYYSTLNPFFLLRDLFGLMVILGTGIAVFRRYILKIPRFSSNKMDLYAVVLVALIIISGILLEGMKITSYSDFTRMVEDYSFLEEEEDLIALESVWVKEFGLVSPNVSGPFDRDILERGMENHEMNCMGCHSSPKWAFTGYVSAKIIGPVALFLDGAGVPGVLYYIHILACFIGFALLPFTKMFHIISTPISLLANSVMDKETSLPENIATRQVMELDACMHCGTCSRFCSAMMGYEAKDNPYILPSEKMALLKDLSKGKKPGKEVLKAVQEGVYLCTNCDRCTVVCPAGINLKELWMSVREGIIQEGEPEPLMLSPFSLLRGLNRKALSADDYLIPLDRAKAALAGSFDLLNKEENPISLPLAGGEHGLSPEIVDKTYSYCFECRNCTNVCPVVDNYENPQEVLGLLPHQIMRCLGLGLYELASGPNMLWECVTCYQCQEHCPQQVKVADILYDLKNTAVRNVMDNI
jgi:heterodisulfide reductase subunit C/nitrate reductase gamma subunit